MAFAEEVAPGRRVWAIGGTGSYGAGLARFLAARSERVLEVARLRGKGAARAPRATPSTPSAPPAARPRGGGAREALRALMVPARALCALGHEAGAPSPSLAAGARASCSTKLAANAPWDVVKASILGAGLLEHQGRLGEAALELGDDAAVLLAHLPGIRLGEG